MLSEEDLNHLISHNLPPFPKTPKQLIECISEYTDKLTADDIMDQAEKLKFSQISEQAHQVDKEIYHRLCMELRQSLPWELGILTRWLFSNQLEIISQALDDYQKQST